MSALTDRIAAEHVFGTATSASGLSLYCDSCRRPVGELMGSESREFLIARHVAEVTEAAVRAQIAADIEAEHLHPDDWDATPIDRGFTQGITAAARIARGESS